MENNYLLGERIGDNIAELIIGLIREQCLLRWMVGLFRRCQARDQKQSL